MVVRSNRDFDILLFPFANTHFVYLIVIPLADQLF